MTDDLEPLFGRRPPCPSCGCRFTDDCGTKTGATIQRRRCRSCRLTFKVPALVFVRYGVDHRPIVVLNT